jgi:hypothetical protein
MKSFWRRIVGVGKGIILSMILLDLCSGALPSTGPWGSNHICGEVDSAGDEVPNQHGAQS